MTKEEETINSLEKLINIRKRCRDRKERQDDRFNGRRNISFAYEFA